jgi:hypothetical protein
MFPLEVSLTENILSIVIYYAIGGALILLIASAIDKNRKSEEHRAKEEKDKLLREEKIQLKPFPKYPETIDDINIVMENIEILSYKINNLLLKVQKLIENNKLLKDMIDDKSVEEIYKKNEQVIRHSKRFYDKYVSLYLELGFGGYLFYINKEDIKTLNIKNGIEDLKKSMLEHIYNFFPKNKSIEQISYDYRETGKVIKQIFEDINTIKVKLVTIQSKMIMSTISPIDNDNELNLIKQFSNYGRIIVDIDSLNKEYDRFISEYEITK